jgi:hypothetical protein
VPISCEWNLALRQKLLMVNSEFFHLSTLTNSSCYAKGMFYLKLAYGALRKVINWHL